MKYKQPHTVNLSLVWLFPYSACSRDRSGSHEKDSRDQPPNPRQRSGTQFPLLQPVLGDSQIFMSINRNQPQRTEIKWNVPQCELKSTSLSRISCRIIRLKCSANHFSCPTWPQSTYTQPESIPDSFNTHGKDELAEPPPMGTALEGAVRDNM